MKIYIDKDYKCYAADDGTMTAVETDFFDGKCKEFIEGYRYVPSGESWTREDGVEFRGEMIAPWKDSRELDGYQRIHEQEVMADMQNALSVLGVNVDG